MKIVISPAKSLNYDKELPVNDYTIPVFLAQAERLSKLMKKKSPKSLSKLMGISSQLGELNWKRYQQWDLPFEPENARQAIYAFNGDVYRGIDAYHISADKVPFMQERLRILSGLYGLLKPLDLIMPYRLEMGTRMAVGRNKNLYPFWQKTIAQALNDEMQEGEILLNLASNEYFKAIDTKLLKAPVITAVFKDNKNGVYKSIMTYAKLARGYMSRYVIEEKIDSIEGLKAFNYEGYSFSEEFSSDTELVFLR